jgi:heme-degrading monooxygenase HmoA
MFIPGALDDEFHILDNAIDEFATSLEGFVGAERWFSDDRKTINAVYYFDSMETVHVFARFPRHLEAKENYQKWYDGYHVVISEVKATYGDGKIPHITSTSDRRLTKPSP